MTEVTISIPLTARFDGFECARDCVHFCGGCTLVGVLAHANENPSLPYISDRQPTWIRPRWCCETFGMGEQAQEQRDITVDGVELKTIDAKDSESLRRWTSE